MKFHKPVIDIGDILHVHIMEGDWVVMNRQPILHRPSMMGFWVVPQDVKTFKVSLAVIKPFNETLMEMKSTISFLKIVWRQQK